MAGGERTVVPSEHAPVRVLYIAGTGRSGSTLLAKTLGSVPGVFAAGEIRFLWERSLVGGELCSCGASFSECPIWSRVSERLQYANLEDAANLHERLRRATRLRRAGGLLIRKRLPDDIPDVIDELKRLYQSLHDITGSALIVDSSKLPNFAALLEHVPGIELTIVHLVRDPRAAAYSWSLGRSSTSDEPMDEISPMRSSVLWTVWNSLTRFRWERSGGRYLRLRYEDLMESPRDTLARLAAAVGLDPERLPLTSADEAHLTAGHLLAGNPNRTERGVVKFRLDRRWESGLERRSRLLVTAVCSPALRRMGYPWRP